MYDKRLIRCRQIRKTYILRYIIGIMRRLAIYIGFMLCCTLSVGAQTVSFTDLSVTDSGSVVLRWTYSNGTALFRNCKLERLNSQTGIYDTMAVINDINTRQYTDTAANALSDSVIYRIRLTSDNPLSYTDSVTLDSAATVLPTVVNVLNRSEYAYVSWNRPYYSSGGQYTVYRKMPNSGWSAVGTTAVERYQDTIRHSICSDTIFYKVEYGDMSRSSLSSQAGAWFTDPNPTTPCTLDVVTVDTATQNIILSWQRSPDPDIMGYFICQGTPCMALDTVWGQNTTSYICTARSSDTVNAFRIYAFDSCFSASALTNPYNNVVLNMKGKHCTRDLLFSWNEYVNMPGGVGRYTLLLRYDNGRYNAVANEPSSARDLRFTIPAGVRRVYALLRISNVGNTRYAFSNISEFDMMTVDTADFIYTLGASVSADGSAMELTFYTDTHFVANGYTVYRRVDMGLFQNYGSIAYTGNPILKLTDSNVDVQAHNYSYFLSVWDECGLIEKKSNRVRQIVATLGKDGDANTLSWTPYDGAGTFLDYSVLKKTDIDTSWEVICVTSTCSIQDFTDPYGNVMYRVEAAYTNPNDNSYCVARSQTVEYHGSPSVWVPNVFTPSRDNNNRFLPKMRSVKSEGYSLRIYNRYGLMVFFSEDVNEPWNGYYKGKIVPTGCYVYIIQYVGEDGFTNVKKGSLTVLK